MENLNEMIDRRYDSLLKRLDYLYFNGKQRYGIEAEDLLHESILALYKWIQDREIEVWKDMDVFLYQMIERISKCLIVNHQRRFKLRSKDNKFETQTSSSTTIEDVQMEVSGDRQIMFKHLEGKLNMREVKCVLNINNHQFYKLKEEVISEYIVHKS